MRAVRHPLLRSYVAALVSSLGTALQAATARAAALKFVLVVVEPSEQRCLERFVFDVRLPQAGAQVQAQAQAQAHVQAAEATADALAALRRHFADALGKLTTCNALLSALPGGSPPCTFTLLLYTNAADAGQPQPPTSSPAAPFPSWLPVELHCAPPLYVDEAESGSTPWLMSIRSIRSALLECEVYIQESAEKHRAAKQRM